MDPWFKTYFESEPNSNCRLNKWIADFDSPITIDHEIFVSPLDQAKAAVNNIVKTFEGPYVLLASGGIDSQAMIWAWEKSGKPYQIVHYDYAGWNYHDTDHLINFLKLNGLMDKLSIKPFDAMAFIESQDLVNYAKEFDCSSPQILTYIKLVEQTPGTAIQAGNYISKSVCGLSYTLMALQRYTKVRQNYVPFFFQNFVNLAYSFILKDLTNQGLQKNMQAAYDAKNQTYLETGFPVLRQADKYTGFEKIKTFFDSEIISHEDRIRWQHLPSKRPFDIMFRYKLYDHIGFYNDKTTIKHHSMVNNLLLGE